MTTNLRRHCHLPRINVALFSKTGCGKSSLANALTKSNKFFVPEERSLRSVTQQCQREIVEIDDGYLLTVVDTPGSMDTSKPQEALMEISQAITHCPMGFDACLLVLRIDVRFTAEEKMAVMLLRRLFGDDFFKYCIVVFSYGCSINNDEARFQSFLAKNRKEMPTVDELLTMCENRAVLVENGKGCDPSVQARQIRKLMDMIISMDQSRQNSGTRVKLRNVYFDKARTYLDEELEKLNNPGTVDSKIVRPRINVLLYGRDDTGKSYLANGLVRSKLFGDKISTCQCEVLEDREYCLSVVNTPESELSELCSAITYCPDGFDTCLLMLKVENSSVLSQDNLKTIRLLGDLFGKDVFKSCIFVFSHDGGRRLSDKEFGAILASAGADESLKNSLEMAQDRMIFYNVCDCSGESASTRQVDKVMDMIDCMEHRRRNRLSIQHFKHAQDHIQSRNIKRSMSDAVEATVNEGIKESNFRMKREDEPQKDQKSASLPRDRKALEQFQRQQHAVEFDLERIKMEQERLRQYREGLEKKRLEKLEEEARSNVAVKINDEMKKNGDSCFPSDAVVFTPDGPIPINLLSVGQSVLCSHNNKLIYSPVYMWGHRDENSCSDSFVTLTTKSARLTLSSDHLLPIIDEMGDEVCVPAGEVCSGDIVQVLHQMEDNSQQLRREKVVAVERSVNRIGLFAPFTMCGTVVVDGVLASCYIRCLPHGVSHALLWPVRVGWRVSPSIMGICNELEADGMCWWVRIISNRVLAKVKWLDLGTDGKC